MHRFAVVFGLTEFDLGSTVYLSSQAFYAGVDPFNDFEQVSRKGSFTFLQQGIIIEIALLLPNSTSRDRHKLGAPNDGFYKGFSSIFPKILDAVQRIIISPSHFRIRKF